VIPGKQLSVALTGKVRMVQCSVIVPTYKEAGNLESLSRRLFKAFKEFRGGALGDIELIFVDDNSRDGSQQHVERLAAQGLNCRIIVRTVERGLSSAVLRGFAEARGEYLICMDADLQHPPEKAPELAQALVEGAEFVLGTRYGSQDSIDKDWPLHRRVISTGARLLALPLSSLNDPMSGFFGIPRHVLQRAVANKVSPIGFKIALEIFVKARVDHSRVVHVPISFGVRTVGESKLSSKVILSYLSHLVELYHFTFPALIPVLVVLILTLLVLLVVKLW